jgi:hypothetical protein
MASVVKAKYDYNSGHEDDLSFASGQMINIIGEEDDEWYNGEYVGSDGKHHQGMFPRNFVTVVPAQDVADHATASKRETKEPTLILRQPEPDSTWSPPTAKTAIDTSGRGPASPQASSSPLRAETKDKKETRLAQHTVTSKNPKASC